MLEKKVWYVKDGGVHEAELSYFSCYIKTAPHPEGVGTVWYVRHTDWGTWALARRFFEAEFIRREFATEDEAIEAVEAIWENEIRDNPDVILHDSRESAEQELREQIENGLDK